MNRKNRRIWFRPVKFSVLALLSFLGTLSQAQAPGRGATGGARATTPPGLDEGLRPVLVQVSVREISGMPLLNSAFVRLFSYVHGVNLTMGTSDGAMASFPNVSPGEYEIEVKSTGYRTTTEHASVIGGGVAMTFYVYVPNENENPAATKPPPGVPTMTPKLQEAVDKGLSRMKKHQFEEALKIFEKALKTAPANPDIHYLVGMAELGLKQNEKARSAFTDALQIYPSHERSLVALGELELLSGDAKKALESLEKAYHANGADWRVHYLLAAGYFKTEAYDKAEQHIARSIELNKGKNLEARILEVKILAASGKLAEAQQALQKTSAEFPNEPAIERTRNQIVPVSAPPPAAQPPSATGPNTTKDSGNTITLLGLTVEKAPSAKTASRAPASVTPVSTSEEHLAATPVLLTPSIPASIRPWAPTDVDSKEYALVDGVACAQDQVILRGQHRMKRQLDNFEKFTATERIVHVEVDKSGIPEAPREKDFSYMVTITHPRDGLTFLEESRDGGENLSKFPTSLATKGLVSLGVAVLDPTYENDFNFRCDGLTKWRGEPAWLLRFEQKKEVPSRVLTWRNLRGSFPVALRGRLWLGANTYDLLHLETDLREAMPTLELALDHLAIDYGPVHFEHGDTDLWLPWHADAYMEFKNKRYHHSHTLTNYLLFSVDTTNKVAAPKEPDPTVTDTPQ